MFDPKFTAGPWHKSNFCEVWAGDTRRVATCANRKQDNRGAHEIAANTVLISYAPDMWAALATLAGLFERASKLHPSRDLREVISDPAQLATDIQVLLHNATPSGE